MSSSTSVDVNYLSLTAAGQWVQDAGSDHPSNVAFPADHRLLPDNPLQYASILKLTGGVVIELDALVVGQGKENSVDINNGSKVILHGEFGTSTPAQGNQIFSVKGGSILSLFGILKGSGNRLNADILIDQWSDQSYAGSVVDLTSAKHETGRKIRVVWRYGASKIVGDIDLQRWESIKLTAYWHFKRAVRLVSGIKLGERGPSWL